MPTVVELADAEKSGARSGAETHDRYRSIPAFGAHSEATAILAKLEPTSPRPQPYSARWIGIPRLSCYDYLNEWR
jgi:hypothetical protein